MTAGPVCRLRDACAIIPPGRVRGNGWRSRPRHGLLTDRLPSIGAGASRVVVANRWEAESWSW
jgi:hypothetical protein